MKRRSRCVTSHHSNGILVQYSYSTDAQKGGVTGEGENKNDTITERAIFDCVPWKKDPTQRTLPFSLSSPTMYSYLLATPDSPETDDSFLGRLSESETWWRDHSHILEEHGYRLRPRYQPGWEPSWRTSGRHPRLCEDHVKSFVRPSTMSNLHET